MKTATNPQTGERIYQDETGAWQPLVTATNPRTGAQIYQAADGTWQPMAPSAPAQPELTDRQLAGIDPEPGLAGSVPLRIPGTDIGTDIPVPASLEAGLVGAGRAATRLGRGVQQLFGGPQQREGVAQREAEEAPLYQPLRERYPVATAVGESAPYFAVPMGAVGGTVGRGLQAARLPGQSLARGAASDAALTGALLGGLDTEGTALGGAVGGAVGGAAGSLLGRAIRPVASQLDEASQAAIDTMRRLGIRQTAGQATGSRPWRQIEASLRSSPASGGAFQRLDEANQRRVNQIAAEAIGESGETALTGEVIDRAFRRVGDDFESVADEPAIWLGDEFLDSLARIESEFGESWTQAPVSRRAINKALEFATAERITGRQALDASQRLGKEARRLWKGANADPAAAEALSGIKDAIDDAIMASVSPAKAQRLSTAREQYRNLLVLERPGVIKSPATGDVSLPTLSNAMRGQDRRGFARGGRGDEFSQMAQVGRSFPQVVGDSGTATRMALPLLAGTASTTGLPEMMEGDIASGATQMLAPWGALALAGRGYTSPLMQNYLQRGLLPLTESGRRILTGTGARAGAGLLATPSE